MADENIRHRSTTEHFPMYGKLTELGEAMVTCLGIEEAE